MSDISKIQYSIVIPVYNSVKSLNILNDEIHSVMDELGGSFEIIYVDDCSADDSWKELLRLKEVSPDIRILRLSNNFGHWMSALCGISKAKGAHIITTDDDLEYDTRDIKNIIEHYNNSDHYIVYGIPEGKEKKNISYRLFYRLRAVALDLLLQKQKTESFKIFDRRIMFDEDNKFRSNLHFEAFTHWTVSPRLVGYLPVKYNKRKFGKSNLTLGKKILNILRYSLEYYKSPFKLLLYLGVFTILISFLLMITTILGFNIIYEMEILFYFAFFLITGLLLIAMGTVGYYLAFIFLMKKGRPEYLIIEEK